MASDPTRCCPRSALDAALGLVLLLAVALPLTALQPRHRITQYAHTAWTVQDGRLPGAVYAVTQTLDGRLWVGTEFGLFRFDGVTFSAWKAPAGKQLPSQAISALAADAKGGLWIGTRDGLAYWNGAELKQYSIDGGASGVSVTSILQDPTGTVWVGAAGFSTGKLCRVQADRLACLTPADGYKGLGTLTLAEDKAGDVWDGSAGGLFCMNARGIRKMGPDDPIQALTVAADGSITVPAAGGLKRLVGDRLVNYVNDREIESPYARVLFTDKDGGLWIGTIGRGLFHLYRGRLDRFTRADGLSGDTVYAVFEDREGTIWAATQRGLDSFRDLPVTMLSTREGLSSNAVNSALAARQGGVWLGTAAGLNRVASSGEVQTVGGSPSTGVGSVFEDRSGTLWMDTPRGFGFLEAGSTQWVEFHRGGEMQSITAAAEDRDGAVWFSDANRGLMRVERHRITEVIPWSRFGNKIASALEANPATGSLLMGFAQGGVAELTGNRVTRWYTAADGLGAGEVRDLRFDGDGTAWIVTHGGLSRLRNGEITTLGASDGLHCAEIFSLVEDDDRNLWLDTSCGLERISRRDLDAWSANPEFKIQPTRLGARDGAHLHSARHGFFRGAAKSKDGRLWFPEFDGVAVVDPRRLPHDALPPPVEIETVAVDRAAQTLRPGMTLPHISQELRIDYTAFSFVDPQRVRFQYRLDGYDRGWIEAGGKREALYPSLPPGNYRFRVAAAINDGVWNNAGAYLDFRVAPTYYQTIWFRLSSAVLVIGLLWMAYRLRVRNLEAALSLRFEERLRERTRISRDLHDSLLQSLSGFALELEGLSKVVTAPPAAKEQLRELRRQAEASLQEARETVTGLRTQVPVEHDLAAAIRRLGEHLTQGKKIRFRVRTSGAACEAAMATHRSLLKVVQEAVRNAVAHSNASEIGVQVVYPGRDRICIEITDDGCGFDWDTASQKPGHWGLTTMRERAQEIGGELRIVSSPGTGVKIEVRAPATPPPDRAGSEDGSDDRRTHSNPHCG